MAGGIRDLLALTMRWWSGTDVTGGPYRVDSHTVYVTGSQDESVYTPGTQRGEVYVTGSQREQVSI